MVALVVTVVFSFLINSKFVTWLISILFAAIIFQLIVALQIGHIGKFSLIAFVVTLPICAFVSGIVLFVFSKMRYGHF